MLGKIIFNLKIIFLPCQSNRYRPKVLASKFLFYYAIFLLLLKIIAIPILFYFPKTIFFADITKTNLIEFTNTARQHLGIQPLRESSRLNQAAHLKAKDMIEKGYFAHYSPEGVSPWYWLKTSGYDYSLAGENLAIGFLDSEQVHQAWMNSFSHKKNILNPTYQEIGLATLTGYFQGNETTFVVQYFGVQRIIFALEQEPLLTLPVKKEEIPAFSEKEKDQRLTEEEQEKNQEKGPITEEPLVFESEEISSVLAQENFGKSPAFFLFQLITSQYYDLLQKVIYASLVLIIFSLLATVYCDIFVYRKFKIDYQDAIFKAIGFSALWFFLVYLDKLIIIQMVTQGFRIN